MDDIINFNSNWKTINRTINRTNKNNGSGKYNDAITVNLDIEKAEILMLYLTLVNYTLFLMNQGKMIMHDRPEVVLNSSLLTKYGTPHEVFKKIISEYNIKSAIF